MKKLNFNRAEDIINTANPKMKKYYKIDFDEIYFWISDKPYRKYYMNLENWQCEVKVQHISYFVDLLQRNNFEKVS
jgi:hypothetical protein